MTVSAVSDQRVPAGVPVVLILAAGLGSRFFRSGGDGHKLQALLGGVSVLQRTIDAVAKSELPYRVLRPADVEHCGMGYTIAAGVQATINASGWLILPGDMPLVRPDTIRTVAGHLATHSVVAPNFHGRKGHPVGFGSMCREQLCTLSGDQGAFLVMQHYRELAELLEVKVDDEGIMLDIDTVIDLQIAKHCLENRGCLKSS